MITKQLNVILLVFSILAYSRLVCTKDIDSSNKIQLHKKLKGPIRSLRVMGQLNLVIKRGATSSLALSMDSQYYEEDQIVSQDGECLTIDATPNDEKTNFLFMPLSWLRQLFGFSKLPIVSYPPIQAELTLPSLESLIAKGNTEIVLTDSLGLREITSTGSSAIKSTQEPSLRTVALKGSSNVMLQELTDLDVIVLSGSATLQITKISSINQLATSGSSKVNICTIEGTIGLLTAKGSSRIMLQELNTAGVVILSGSAILQIAKISSINQLTTNGSSKVDICILDNDIALVDKKSSSKIIIRDLVKKDK